MAVTIKNIIPRKNAASGFETQYTATNATAIIDKFTATNIDSTNQTISVYLVPQGGSPGGSNVVVAIKSIQPYETYLFPELVGQVLLNGGYIETESSAGSALVLSATGREIT